VLLAAALSGVSGALEARRETRIDVVDPWADQLRDGPVVFHWEPHPRDSWAEIRAVA
jgi:hypothetical protein